MKLKLFTIVFYLPFCFNLGWISGMRSLKPFTYPVPETRFLHAGVNVYKFKIRYGNTISINNNLPESVVNEELQNAIRVILGNIDNLCPFTTEHFTIFPYLNTWEKVSDLRFMYGDIFLIPYPFVCTIYVELNSWKQNAFGDKAEYSNAYNCANMYGPREHMNRERAVNRRRLENTVGVSQMQLYAERNMLTNAAHVNKSIKTRIQEDTIDPKQNRQYCDSANVDNGYDNRGLWECKGYMKTKKAENRQREEQEPILQNGSQGNPVLKKAGFLELLKSLFSALLQRIFSGIREVF
nr:PREDICTED: membrane-anchored junction protein [Anolis carolinensis]|eukprot:XP_008107099.2 PREDICTED: membrane-anchored junction protein [Anolis carolinensis]